MKVKCPVIAICLISYSNWAFPSLEHVSWLRPEHLFCFGFSLRLALGKELFLSPISTCWSLCPSEIMSLLLCQILNCLIWIFAWSWLLLSTCSGSFSLSYVTQWQSLLLLQRLCFPVVAFCAESTSSWPSIKASWFLFSLSEEPACKITVLLQLSFGIAIFVYLRSKVLPC